VQANASFSGPAVGDVVAGYYRRSSTIRPRRRPKTRNIETPAMMSAAVLPPNPPHEEREGCWVWTWTVMPLSARATFGVATPMLIQVAVSATVLRNFCFMLPPRETSEQERFKPLQTKSSGILAEPTPDQPES
jgi:hypothetical protein